MISKVKRETMRACLSCPLCENLLHDATTISECLHTFCRKCIYEKITEDEIESCPVCNIDLGGAPLEKLRPDHNLQDLRAKIFSLKRKKVKAPEIVSLPAKRKKKRSISSLVVNTPKVFSAQAGTTRKRTKSVLRKDLRGSDSSALKKEESFEDELLESTSSPEKLKKSKRQSNAESFSNKENKDGDDVHWDSKLNHWKPLNYLVEVANNTKPLKSSASQGSGSKPEHGNASHNQFQASIAKAKDQQKSKRKHEDEKSNNGDPTTSETATPKRLPRTQRKRPATIFGDSRNSPQPDESSAKPERRYGPVWFSLVASTDQDGETSLPQIPANYLRIKDGNIPVSFIQKYLRTKLDLESETEIEIRCKGEALIPSLKLHKLVDLWLQKSSKRQRFAASIGSSAKDYMMVLVYSRKPPECNKSETVGSEDHSISENLEDTETMMQQLTRSGFEILDLDQFSDAKARENYLRFVSSMFRLMASVDKINKLRTNPLTEELKEDMKQAQDALRKSSINEMENRQLEFTKDDDDLTEKLKVAQTQITRLEEENKKAEAKYQTLSKVREEEIKRAVTAKREMVANYQGVLDQVKAQFESTEMAARNSSP